MRHTAIRDTVSAGDRAKMDSTRRVVATIAACDRRGLAKTFQADQDPPSHRGSQAPESKLRHKNYLSSTTDQAAAI